MSDNEYLIVRIICNMIIVLFSVSAICFIEFIALKNRIDGSLMGLSIAIIALIAGVKGKEIKEAMMGIFKRK